MISTREVTTWRRLKCNRMLARKITTLIKPMRRREFKEGAKLLRKSKGMKCISQLSSNRRMLQRIKKLLKQTVMFLERRMTIKTWAILEPTWEDNKMTMWKRNKHKDNSNARNQIA
jgi:hypothetical protein